MGAALEWSSLNGLKNIDFLVGRTPAEISAQIKQITCQCKLLALYHDGTQHVAWVQTNFPIKKKIKGV